VGVYNCGAPVCKLHLFSGLKKEKKMILFSGLKFSSFRSDAFTATATVLEKKWL
jgi:hypothetical protein